MSSYCGSQSNISSLLRTPSMMEQLIEEINFQRAKEMRQLLKDNGGFGGMQGTTYWTDLFVRHFLFQTELSIDCDDLLFFVRKKHIKGSSRFLPKFETEVEVFRKDSRKLPIGDPDIDWEETVYLNLIIHQFDYMLTLAICTRTSPKQLQVLKRHSQKVYASPSRRRMDTKGETEDMTYPYVCFMVDNFDEVFSDIMVRDGEMVCVELVACGRDGSTQGVIFLGSIRYDALKWVYDARASTSTKMSQKMTFGFFSSASSGRIEYVRMKGPDGKGHAEMAVTKPPGAGCETPSSEPGTCAIDMWDQDWNQDPEDFFVYRYQIMVVICSAPGCSAKKDSVASKTSVQFHRFPLRKPEVLAKWVKAMKNPNFKPTVTSYLCSAHFTSSDYDLKPTPNGKHLKPTAVPTVFEKRRPGRKKKILSENEVTEEIKENEDEFIEAKELEEGFEEEYLEVSSSDKVQTDLAEIIGDQEKGTLQVLIVGEDGKITNSEYIFKKEMYSDDDDDDSKTEFDTLPLEDTRDGEETDDEILSQSRESNGETESQTELSSNIELLNIRDVKNKEKIKRLETSLMITKRKVKLLQMKCGKMSKTIAELKILLKLLVLKRGKGEKNLKELLEEYEKIESEDLKMSIKEEEDYS